MVQTVTGQKPGAKKSTSVSYKHGMGPNSWFIFCCLPTHAFREPERNQSIQTQTSASIYMGYCGCRWQLHPLHFLGCFLINNDHIVKQVFCVQCPSNSFIFLRFLLPLLLKNSTQNKGQWVVLLIDLLLNVLKVFFKIIHDQSQCKLLSSIKLTTSSCSQDLEDRERGQLKY